MTDDPQHRRFRNELPQALVRSVACGSVAFFSWLAGCHQVPPKERTGGETHFLAACDTSAECGAALSCECGLCTLACSAQADCSGLQGAECLPVAGGSTCDGTPPRGVCDVRCASDANCQSVSASTLCAGGLCRTDPDASASGGEGGSTPGAGGASSCEAEDVAGNQVLVIGDSFFGATHQITAYLEDLARNRGALAVGERYRDNSAVTDNTLALGSQGIAAQYASAIADAPVKVVIMNGGGSDALLGSCETPTADCPVVADAARAVEDLLAQMADDEVTHVVYAFYPDYEDVGLRDKLDALRPLVQSSCATSAAPCHFLDLRPTFSGHSDYVDSSGVLPTAAGAEATAQAIWSLMQRECIAQ